MKYLYAIALAFPLGSSGMQEDSLVFAAEAEAAVVRAVSSQIDLDLVGGFMRMDGEEMPVPDNIELAVQHATALELEDVYREVADGRPITLERTYAGVERSIVIDVAENGDEEDHVEDAFTSDLEEEGVRWRWDADEKRYGAAWLDEDTSLSDELLEGLAFDFDALALLPDGDVEAGASWTIEAADLAALLGLGGDLAFVPNGSDMSDEMVPAVFCTTPAHLRDDFTGELEATLATVDSSSGRIAVIELTGEVLCSGDVAASANAYSEALGGEDDLFEEVELVARFELEGSLQWDLEAGRVASLELAGPHETTIRAVMPQGEVQIEFEGRGEWSLEVE